MSSIGMATILIEEGEMAKQSNAFYEGAMFAALVGAICRDLAVNITTGEEPPLTEILRSHLRELSGLLEASWAGCFRKEGFARNIGRFIEKASDERAKCLFRWVRRCANLRDSDSITDLGIAFTGIKNVIASVVDGSTEPAERELLLTQLVAFHDQLLQGEPAEVLVL